MIDVKDLFYTYPGNDEPTLKGLNFKVNKGEIFGFLGPSGAGKSTAQKVLYKILKDYKGEVSVNNKELRNWNNSYLENIGVGFELPNHYLKLSGKENLELFASFYSSPKRMRTEELFDLVDLTEAMDQPIESYSKGMKMRLNFLRAIQHNPNILFFDEPTSGLDPVNAHKIKQHILRLKEQGKTIFITTHSMETADDICDRVSFIVNGELRITDSPKNLKKTFGKESTVVELVSGTSQEFALEGLGENASFLQFIKSGEVKRIHSQEASLEEVFIQLTGEKLQ